MVMSRLKKSMERRIPKNGFLNTREFQPTPSCTGYKISWAYIWQKVKMEKSMAIQIRPLRTVSSFFNYKEKWPTSQVFSAHNCCAFLRMFCAPLKVDSHSVKKKIQNNAVTPKIENISISTFPLAHHKSFS